jgi:hypothetical protein
MAAVRRRLFTLCSALSLLLCVAAAWAFFRSTQMSGLYSLDDPRLQRADWWADMTPLLSTTCLLAAVPPAVWLYFARAHGLVPFTGEWLRRRRRRAGV